MADLGSREELGGEESPATHNLVLTKLRRMSFPHASQVSRICVSPDSQILAVTLQLDEKGPTQLSLFYHLPKPPLLACGSPGGPDTSRMESLAVCSASSHFWLTPSAPSSWCRGRNILVVLTAEGADSSVLWIQVSNSEHGLTLVTVSSLTLPDMTSLLMQDQRAISIQATLPLPKDQLLSFQLVDCKHDEVLIVADPCFIFLISLSSEQKAGEESLPSHSQKSPLLSTILPLYPRDDRTPPVCSPLDSFNLNPREIGTLTGVNIRGPILLSLYTSGRIFLHHLPSGGNLGVLSVPSYIHHALSEEADTDSATCLSPPYLRFSTHPHLEYIVVANKENYVIVLYLRRYLALFPAHVNLGVVGVPASVPAARPDGRTVRLHPDQEDHLLRISQVRPSRLSSDSPLWQRRLKLMRERQTSPHTPTPPPDPTTPPSDSLTTSSRHSPFDSTASPPLAGTPPVPPSEPQLLDNPFSSHFTHEIPSTPSDGCVWFSSPTATEQLQTSVISCHSNSFTLFYSRLESPDNIAHVCVFSLQTGERLSTPLDPPCLPVRTHSHTSDRLLLLLQGEWAVCPVVGLSRQSLLGGILTHCDASAAELLCQHNGWQQSLLPVSVLRESLAHKQLDSVCFYLRMRRTREGELELVGGTGAGGGGEDVNGLPMPHASIKQSIDTLYGTLRGSFKDSYEAQFSSQILNLSHKFLLFLLVRFSATSHPDPDTGGEGTIGDEFIASQLSIFRQFMSVDTVTPGSTERVDSLVDREFAEAEGGEGTEASTPAEWRHMRRSDIIRDGLDRQNLPLAQTYLHSRLEEQVRSQGGPENAASPLDLRHRSSEISWLGIKRLVLHLAYQCLEREDPAKCEQRLAVAGPCVTEMFRYIAVHTCSRFARSVLFSELKSRGELEEEEVNLLEYLHILEHTYPSASYKQSLSNAQKISKLSPSTHSEYPSFKDTPLPSLLTELWWTGEMEEKIPESFGANKPLLSSSSPGKRDAYYFAGTYSWLRRESPQERDSILMEGFLLKEEHHSQECRQVLPPHTLLLLYVTSQLGLRAGQHVSRLGKDAQMRESLAESVTAVLEEADRATSFTRRILTSELTEVGVVPSPPTEHVLFLSRVFREVSENRLLLSRAPSLKRAKGRLEEFLLQLSCYSAAEGCAGFLSLCLEDLASSHSLPTSRLLSVLTQREEAAPVWIEMLVISQHLYTPDSKEMAFKEAMFRYSIANARYILEQPHIRLADTFLLSKALIPLATLVYSPVPLEQTIGGSAEYSVPRETFIQAIQPYPKLLGALFPSGARSGSVSSAPLQEVTVYQLLQGSVPFNMQQMFVWQSTNCLSEKTSVLDHSRTVLPSALHTDFPHFSSSQLSQTYGYPQRLDYVHYLNKGNPAFAYANLLAADPKVESKYCSKRMKAVCQRVYRLGLSQFSAPKITASCSALMEMLGWDSAPFRTDIVLLNLLVQYQGHNAQIKQHALSLQDGLSQQQQEASPAHPGISAIPLHAEEVFKGLLASGELLVNNFAAAEVWAVLETFCQYHDLPPTRGYLARCASANLWPQLLSYAQMWSCPPKLLLQVIREHFLDAEIRGHLETSVLVMLDKSGPRTERSKKKPVHKQSSRIGNPAQKRDGERETAAVRKISLLNEPAAVPRSPLHGDTPPPEIFELLPLDRSSRHDRSEDLFELICASQICSYPTARTLLAFGVSLRRNILPIMATCFLPQAPDVLYEEGEAEVPPPPPPSQAEHGSIMDCLCVWIFCKLAATRELITAIQSLGIVQSSPPVPLHQSSLLQWHQWQLSDLERVCVCLSADMPSYGIILGQAFRFFDHENPFFFFLRFVETYALHSFDQSQRQLEGFLVSMKKLCSGEQQYPKTSLGSPKWVSDLTSLCLLQMLAHPITPWHHISLLTTVIKALERVPQPNKLPKNETYDPSQSDSFTGYPVPLGGLLDTQTLSQLLSVMQRMERVPIEITSRCTLPVIPDIPTSAWFNTLSRPLPTALPPQELISQLADLDLTEVVQQVCAIVDVYPTKAVLRSFQLRHQRLAKSSWWHLLENRLAFWRGCDTALQYTTGDVNLVAEFFELIASSCPLEGGEGTGGRSMYSDTILLRQLALDWHLKCPTPDPVKVSELKKLVWLSRLEWINSSADPNLCLGDVLSLQSKNSDAIGFYDITQLCTTQPLDRLLAPTDSGQLGQRERDALDITIGYLLDSNLVHLALELADLFKYRPLNLVVVCTCICLAQKLIEQKDVHPAILAILQHPEGSGESSLLAPDLQLSHLIQLFRVRLEQTDSPSLTGGSRCLERIQALIQVSQGLVMSYQVTANESTRTSLLTILTSEELGQKFQLALPFVRSCCVDPSKLSRFLERCVYITLCRHFGHSYEEEPDDPVMVRPVFDVDCKSELFSELSRVCDEAELGRLLLQHASKDVQIAQVSKSPPKLALLQVCVELLIRAETSLSNACQLDQISALINSTLTLAKLLTLRQSWSLLARLLTGIGRFHELSAILEIFVNHEQLEYLLKKGLEKEELLKTALLKFLVKHHENDIDKLTIVAMRFNLYRGLGETCVKQAKIMLRKLTRDYPKLEDFPDVQERVREACKLFCNAATYYSQDECYLQSCECKQQARLMCVQSRLLPHNIVVINVTRTMIRAILSSPSRNVGFSEALIIVEAYSLNSAKGWGDILHGRCVCHKNNTFLSSYISKLPFDPSVYKHLVNRFTTENIKNTDSRENLINILNTIPDLVVKETLLGELPGPSVRLKSHHAFSEGLVSELQSL